MSAKFPRNKTDYNKNGNSLSIIPLPEILKTVRVSPPAPSTAITGDIGDVRVSRRERGRVGVFGGAVGGERHESLMKYSQVCNLYIGDVKTIPGAGVGSAQGAVLIEGKIPMCEYVY
ncbi:hypothetical protein J6590_033845 [Homalodisca vitripennis]|nr:hypothetical protein J6590_033845 [Homalodisca vitripennis]